MNINCIKPKKKNVTRFGISTRVLLLMLMTFLVFGAVESQALDYTNFRVSIGTFRAEPGDTAWMPIYLYNYDAANPDTANVAGFYFRIVYDQHATANDLLRPIVDYTDVDPNTSDVYYYFKAKTVGRGNGLWYKESVVDSTLYLYVKHLNPTEVLADTLIVTYIPPFGGFGDTTGFSFPQVAAAPDSSIILYIPFLVDENAQLGDYTKVEFRNDTNQYVNEVENHISTIDGLYFPPLIHNEDNYFIVSPPDTGFNCDTCTYGCCNDTCCEYQVDNDPPVVAALSQSSYSIDQGQTVSFNVSASDPDAGDEVCLQAVGLPANASFNPSNPVCGTDVTVTGSFSWTPSFEQEGTYSITFRATDSHNASNSRSVTISVAAIDKDRLYTSSTYGAHPVGGVPGATPVSFPIDLASTKTVYGINFDMTYPAEIAFLDSFTVTDRTPEYVVYDNIGDYPDSIKIIAFGLNNEPVANGTSSAIFNAWFTLDSGGIPGDYWVNFYDAWESISPDPEVPSDFLEIDSGIIQIDMYGDVNLDQHIDVADLVNVVAYVIGNYDLAKRNYETANVVLDSLVNVVDLVGIVNMMFGYEVDGTPAPVNAGGELATVKIVHDDLLAGQMTKLNVQGEFPDDVAGIQLQIDYDPEAVTLTKPEIPDEVDNFSMSYTDDGSGRMSVVMYSRSPWKYENTIRSGSANLLNLPATIKKDIGADDESSINVTRAYLSNGQAREILVDQPGPILPTTFVLKQNYPNPFNPVTNIQFEIGSQDGRTKHVTLDIFNILGQKVTTLVDDNYGNGTYSVKWDATTDGGQKVATGVYLYKLTVDDMAETKKMMLLK